MGIDVVVVADGLSFCSAAAVHPFPAPGRHYLLFPLTGAEVRILDGELKSNTYQRLNNRAVRLELCII